MDIKEALIQLDPEMNEQWTEDGLPLVDSVKELTGNEELTRQDITDADPTFNRDLARSRPIKNSGGEPPAPPGLDDVKKESVTKRDLDDQINELGVELSVIQNHIALLTKERNRVQQEEFNNRSSASDTLGRMKYIRSQSEQRKLRHEQSQLALKALGGVANVDPRSKLDQSMARKTARGTQRPTR